MLKNKCLVVTQTVKNCEIYSSSSSCHQCEKDYLLIENTCVLNQNFDCAENSNQTQCTSCPDTLPILNSDKICVRPDNIPNCLEFTFDATKGTYICSKCEPYFNVIDGLCQLIKAKIQNCSFYGDENQCLKCASGFYFDTSSKICRIATKFEANCELFQAGGQCSVCDVGYYMDYQGQCQPCTTDKEKCDFCDINEPSKCLVCKSGYYMDHTGTCLK